jgi:hypothetical protein
MSPYPTVIRHPDIWGSLPGPSRTITVEPIRIPASPREVPRTEPQHEPERRPSEPKREPAQVVALELPLSLGAKRRSVREIADRLGVAAVAHRRLRSVARERGVPVDASLRPPRVREPVVTSWRWSLVS